MVAGTTRTLTDGTVNASYVIESLSPPNDNGAGLIKAEITFVEV